MFFFFFFFEVEVSQVRQHPMLRPHLLWEPPPQTCAQHCDNHHGHDHIHGSFLSVNQNRESVFNI